MTKSLLATCLELYVQYMSAVRFSCLHLSFMYIYKREMHLSFDALSELSVASWLGSLYGTYPSGFKSPTYTDAHIFLDLF